jgi:poly(3-hydroxybutyrate) depolymerase
MFRILYFVTITLFLVFQAYPQSSEFEARTFNNGAGFTLPYRFYIPKNIQADKKYPLIIFLHGAGDWGTNNTSQLANFPYHYIDATNSAKYPCYFLAPQCTKNSPWSSFPNYPDVQTEPFPTKSTAQVLSLIDTLLHRDTVKIDKNRIYITGFSLGGEGAFDMITRAPDLFAAAIPICGIADTSKAHLMKNTPLWIFHGSEDNVNSVTYSRMIVDALKKIGAPPKYTEYEGYDHNVWDTAYNEPDLLPWLFSHGKPVNNKLEQVRHNAPVSLIKINTIVHITWNPSVRPDLVELFSLNGRCLLIKNVNSRTNYEYLLDLANSGISPNARYLLRVSAKKKVVSSGVR